MIALGYIWKVVVNIVILFIVAWALDKLNGRTEALQTSEGEILYRRHFPRADQPSLYVSVFQPVVIRGTKARRMRISSAGRAGAEAKGKP